MLRLSFLLHFRFRQKRIQLSEYLTYPHCSGFTVTDSRGLSPTFLLPFGTAKDCNHLEFSLSYRKLPALSIHPRAYEAKAVVFFA